MRENLGLNDPLPVQYFKWLKNAVRGDFGISLIDQRPVWVHIGQALPNTLLLSSLSLLLIFSGGIFLGTVQASRKNSLFDHGATLTALFFYSIPSFWLALMLILVFSLQLGLFPASGITSIDAHLLSPLDRFFDTLHHLILPALALSLAPAAGVARYMRASLVEVIGQDFIRTASAKGLARNRIILKHGMRNAFLPIITLLGLSFPFLFSGAVLVESIFAWPGMGRLMVDKILQRDYPVVMGVTFFFGLAVVLGNLMADLLYALADPRIRYRK
jgi:peptide/nickel transport system permease protein